VEDSVRHALKDLLDTSPGLADEDFVFSRQRNLETIHTHDVVAERTGTVGELREELDGHTPRRHTSLAEWLAR
jgi:GTP cyclohydrolase I/GTP cyclohydrolase-4